VDLLLYPHRVSSQWYHAGDADVVVKLRREVISRRSRLTIERAFLWHIHPPVLGVSGTVGLSPAAAHRSDKQCWQFALGLTVTGCHVLDAHTVVPSLGSY